MTLKAQRDEVRDLGEMLTLGRQESLRETPGSPTQLRPMQRASAPGVGNGRPSLKCRQVAALVADNATSWAKKEKRQNGPFNPTLRRRGPELVSLAYTAMGG